MALTALILTGKNGYILWHEGAIMLKQSCVCREYPVASERGGKDADLDNYVSFLKNLRTALDSSGMPGRPGLSITIVRYS